jgi:flagellar biosynthetic protein FlhB
MADERPTGQERTESPTPRRREQARREGKVARTPELPAAAVLLAGGLALAAAGGRALADYAAGTLRASAAGLSGDALTPGGAAQVLRSVTLGLLAALFPLMLAVAGAAVLVNLAQTRGAASWGLLQPRGSHLDPVAGMRRLLGPDAAIHLIKAALKVAVLGAVAAFVIVRSGPDLMGLADAGPAAVALALRDLLLRLAVAVGLAFAGLAVVDYGVQWFRHERSLRMSRQEIVYEQRETEGDPMIKARMLSVARARARQRMLQQVPTADVIVVNPTEIAVALRYDTALAAAPVVVAMGRRKLAQRIRDIARRHRVPVVENRPVARALISTAKVGHPIPVALYAAVAEILAFVYRQRGLHHVPAAAGRSAP